MEQQADHTNVKQKVPVHLLSGFLGSGKTTLLNQAIHYYQAAYLKVAVIMNELGEVNLDGQFVDEHVPMAEMLGGCICCTIRGDLGMELKSLLDEHQPDVVLIESTGAANPLEMIDGVTETSMYTYVELQSVITVVDGPELLARSRKGGRTFKLMQDQIRCATDLVVNKADLLAPEQLVEVEQLVREWNAYAPLTVTVRCAVEPAFFEGRGQSRLYSHTHRHDGHVCSEGCSHHEEHAGHEHVMALTYYLPGRVDSHKFEAFMKQLPEEVYRAKGIVAFSDLQGRFMFQFAYRELECFRIRPQGQVNDVAVFIGEHFEKDELQSRLAKLFSDASDGYEAGRMDKLSN
ncbi:CobW family GTP-binding protein [Paenibacillus sp. GCM10027626]|uniref:CobW family GTP-binding protein n=1 Tax=Paenibacillus sp. GCM10027626 TaxID=3273411 RepID=UPI003624EC06